MTSTITKVALIFLVLASCGENKFRTRSSGGTQSTHDNGEGVNAALAPQNLTIPAANFRFGVDGAEPSAPALGALKQAGFGLAGINAGYWIALQEVPSFPVNRPIYNEHAVAKLDSWFDNISLAGMGVQLNISLEPLLGYPYQNLWFMEFEPGSSTIYEDGATGPLLKRIKPQHHKAYQQLVGDIVKRYRSKGLRIIQIGSEEENVWSNGQGYLEALRLAHGVIKELAPEIQIWAGGFNAGKLFGSTPAEFAQWVKDAGIPPALSNTYIARKQKFWREFFDGLKSSATSPFDVLSLHLAEDHRNIHATVQHFRQELSRSLTASESSRVTLVSEDTATAPRIRPVGQNDFRLAQARNLVKKSVVGFAAGLSQIFTSSGYDWDHYFVPFWLNAGLVSYDGKTRHAAYYAQKRLIEGIGQYTSVADRSEQESYNFWFQRPNGTAVVAWTDGTPKEMILKGIAIGSYRVSPLIPTLGNPVNSPAFASDQIIKTNASRELRIQLTQEPVIIVKQ